MPGSCCIPGCKSNYKGKYIPIFTFPKDEVKRDIWKKRIPRRDLIITKNTVVCIKHFSEECLLKDISVTRPDGSKLTLQRRKIILTENAYPTIFPNLPNYLTSVPPPRRSDLIQRKNKYVQQENEKYETWLQKVADTCRLCLRPFDEAKSSNLLTETTKLAMLKEFLPEMNLDISENTQVCNKCLEELETSYNFKHGAVVSEANIQSKLEGKKLKKIDLKLMLDDIAKKELKKNYYICRTCLSITRTPNISLFDSPSNMMPCSFVKKMCQAVFELEFIASAKPVLCDDCWETLQTVYNFRKCCLRTDKRLRIYVALNNITKLSIEEFKKFAEQYSVNDEVEDSSDDEFDGYIKDEPIDEEELEEELKVDPDEVLSSSNSIKVEEETEVKSESDLKSEDEDMENKPELRDPKTVKSETSELDEEGCKMEIGDVKVDAEGESAAGPSGWRPSDNDPKQHSLKKSWRENGAPTLLQKKVQNKREENKLRTDNKSDLTEHSAIHQPGHAVRMFTCTYCSYCTRHKSSLMQHMYKHQPDDKVQIFNCDHCSLTTKYKSVLARHLIRIHQLDKWTQEFSCTHCSFVTKYKAGLICHMRSHQRNNGVTMFVCTQCPYKTKYKSNLRKHVPIHQPDDAVQMLSCAICPYKTKNKSYLRRHERLHQPDEVLPILTCTHCPYKTKNNTHLRLHTRIHQSDDAVKKFRCTQCSYRSAYKSHFRQHLLTHQSDDEVQMFNCTQCSYKAKSKLYLKKHIKLVHQQQMLSCIHCTFNTRNKSSLAKHVFRIH